MPADSPDKVFFCTQCHIEAFFPPVDEHVLEQTGFAHDGQELLCVTCHMVGTATSGAQSPELLDELPSTDQPVWYFWGDIAGHRFDPQPTSLASEQPVPATNACASCHASFLPNPPAP